MKNRLVILIFLIISILFVFVVIKKPWVKSGPKLQEATVTKGLFQMKVQASGTVSPENRFLVTPPLAGRIDRLYFEEGALVKKGQVIGLMSSLDRVALVDSNNSQVTNEIREMYKPIPLIAPQAGQIISRPVNEGQNVTPQDKIFEISNRLIVETRVDESDIAMVNTNQKAELVVDAFRDKLFTGRVSRVGHQSVVQNSINTYLVIIDPDQTIPGLKSGMSVSTYFITREESESLLLPAWVSQGKHNTTIKIIAKDSNDNFIDKQIKIGESNGEYVEVLSGLSSGEKIYSEVLNIEVFKNSFMNSSRKN